MGRNRRCVAAAEHLLESDKRKRGKGSGGGSGMADKLLAGSPKDTQPRAVPGKKPRIGAAKTFGQMSKKVVQNWKRNGNTHIFMPGISHIMEWNTLLYGVWGTHIAKFIDAP